MNTTRKTIWTARSVAAVTAVASYFWTGLFFDFLLAIGSSRAMCAIMGVAVAVIGFDMFHRVLVDYRVRIALLAGAYGTTAATIAVLVAPWL